MPLPTQVAGQNYLNQVQTYQMSELAYLQNTYAQIANYNKKFKDFEKLTGNLGSSVTYDVQPKFATSTSLVANFQTSAQQVRTLTVDQSWNTSYQFTSEQFVFNVKDYMQKFGKTAAVELGSKVESYISSQATSHIYRYFGNGTTAINSYGQLANAIALLHNIGAPRGSVKGFIPDIAVPSIVSTGLQQFVLDRNERTANSWELGSFGGVDWYSSNLLDSHMAGFGGVNGTVLTVTGVARDTDGAITSITCSTGGLAATTNFLMAGDVMKFNDGVAGQPNVRFFTYNGQVTSASPVQLVCKATVNSILNSVTFSFDPKLYDTYSVTQASNPTWYADNLKNQNVNVTITNGMQLSIANSHVVGYLMAGDAGFLSTPRLPDQIPFPTSNLVDPDTGLSFRKYYGAKFGLNQMGFVNDIIAGVDIVPEYCLKILFPISTALV